MSRLLTAHAEETMFLSVEAGDCSMRSPGDVRVECVVTESLSRSMLCMSVRNKCAESRCAHLLGVTASTVFVDARWK